MAWLPGAVQKLCNDALIVGFFGFDLHNENLHFCEWLTLKCKVFLVALTKSDLLFSILTLRPNSVAKYLLYNQ